MLPDLFLCLYVLQRWVFKSLTAFYNALKYVAPILPSLKRFGTFAFNPLINYGLKAVAPKVPRTLVRGVLPDNLVYKSLSAFYNALKYVAPFFTEP